MWTDGRFLCVTEELSSPFICGGFVYAGAGFETPLYFLSRDLYSGL
jgi:hypothetical protein